MYRQTDDRKVWYEWMVEVFFVEHSVSSSTSTVLSPVMSGGRIASPGVEGSKGRSNDAEGAQRTCGTPRRVKVGMSELHSSIKEGCLM